MMFGFLNMTLWGYLLTGFVLTHITTTAVTIYLHRYQTHRALTLHPVVSHFFRFWLWLTTGMTTAEWVAIHRKHHANTDMEGDPHSPQVFTLKKVFWQVPELYREASKDKDMIKKYSSGTPNDWIERKLYSPHANKGIFLMLVLNLFLFGIPGITLWAIQMMWIPLVAGVVNGIGHYWGYRNHESSDSSTNVFPWGLLIAGEELHNNHHTFASSAKFSIKWWEFDLGWFYISCLSFLKLAKVKKLPPKLIIDKNKSHIDVDSVKAILGNRFQVISDYYKLVIFPTLRDMQYRIKNRDLKNARHLLKKPNEQLSHADQLRLKTLLKQHDNLQAVHNYRELLQQIWLKTSLSNKDLLNLIQRWCSQAEESGLLVLRQFASQLKSYSL
ncbi:TPA: acyl-CoA desaturase [Legionella pneumophila]|nr:fatty acid desaturase [Legionella pneumophila]HAT8868302.1 acyl-CoA desaturase [Legionella pneumophila subsp. pneumophila]HAT7073210.1 acyl-CoA desaturase [Legionella pneumophila]HAT8642264.1 acyl-CoA desaturase [Legionella pneumophila]HAT8890679.1 acyl-CoA desaturase [Legionella pneumophila subsp. pneumophila]HAT8933151.1 acyl-CoA desaturase [Legionella pneumophila subsp. pneumophila]